MWDLATNLLLLVDFACSSKGKSVTARAQLTPAQLQEGSSFEHITDSVTKG